MTGCVRWGCRRVVQGGQQKVKRGIMGEEPVLRQEHLFLQRQLSTNLSVVSMFRFIIVICVFCCVQSASAGIPRNNYAVLETMVRECAQVSGAFLKGQGIDTCGIHFSEHPAVALLRNAFVALPHIYFLTNDSKRRELEIEIADCAVRYFRYSDAPDSVIREVQVQMRGVLHRPGAVMQSLPEFQRISRDTVSRADIPLLENPGYSYTKSIVPEPEKGFLSEIAEPVVLIAVAAISVLLLFSIRSQ